MPQNRCWGLWALPTIKTVLKCLWCKRIFPHKYNGTCFVPPREQMCSLSVFLHDYRKKNNPFMTKQWPAGWTCFKRIIKYGLNWMHWNWIDSSSAGGYELCLQWGQCWFEFHSSKGNCPPQSSKTSSPTRWADVFDISIFHMIGERTTTSLWHDKDRQAELVSKRNTKCRLNLTECLERTFPGRSRGLYNVKTDNLIYRNYCGMNTSHLHLLWVNVVGSTHVQSPRPASSSS